MPARGRRPKKKAARKVVGPKKTTRKAAKRPTVTKRKDTTRKTSTKAPRKLAKRPTVTKRKTTARRTSKAPATRSKGRPAARRPEPQARPVDELGSNVLHILNGDTVLALWQRADLPGRTLVHGEAWADGPVARDLDAVTRKRIEWLAQRPGATPDMTSRMQPFVDTLRRFEYGDEVVLWGEADLFCLVNLLGAHSLIEADAPTVHIAWSGSAIAPQGELAVRNLAEYPRRLSPIERSVLRRVWDAYTEPSPTAIANRVGDPRLENLLPGASPLLGRHLRRLPDKKSGLGDDERFLLQRVVDGDHTLPALLGAVGDDPDMAMYGYTDLAIAGILAGLAGGKSPLVRIKGLDATPHGFEVHATRDARAVLGGRANRVKLCGIDRWIGAMQVTKENARAAAALRPASE